MKLEEVKTFKKALALCGASEVTVSNSCHSVKADFDGYDIWIGYCYSTKKFKAILTVNGFNRRANSIGFSLKAPDLIAKDLRKRLINIDEIKKLIKENEERRDKERSFSTHLSNLANKFNLFDYNRRSYHSTKLKTLSLHIPYECTERFEVKLSLTSFEELESYLILINGGLSHVN